MQTLLAALVIAAARRSLPPIVDGPEVRLVRVPDGGLQPQAAVDESGELQLLWFRGDPIGGDLWFARSSDGGTTFPAPIRVNHDDGDAVAIGNVRGAHLALGRDGSVHVSPVDATRVHVAFMGSAKSRQRGPGKSTPMLYTHLAADGKSFEPERNVIRAHPGLDGGGALAADRSGRVYVAWHAPRADQEGEEHRTVWVAASDDDGATFAEEREAWSEPTGACACCGMRAACRGDELVLLYRAAREGVHRDMYALLSGDHGRSFRGVKLDEWRVAQCVMSTASFAPAPDAMVAAWEDEGAVAWARIEAAKLDRVTSVRPPPAPDGRKPDRKHPSIAVNRRGELLLAWTEGMGWERGGALAWQCFDRDGRPIAGASGRRDGVPPWSLVAAAALGDGSFVVIF